jgi:hypothetical protein
VSKQQQRTAAAAAAVKAADAAAAAHLQVSVTNVVTPCPPRTPQPVAMIPEMRVQHCLEKSNVVGEAAFVQHYNLKPQVGELLGLCKPCSRL